MFTYHCQINYTDNDCCYCYYLANSTNITCSRNSNKIIIMMMIIIIITIIITTIFIVLSLRTARHS